MNRSFCTPHAGRRNTWPVAVSSILAGAFVFAASICSGLTLREDGYHVFPGDNIQDALEQAAGNKTNKVVKVHAGEYRPSAPGQALIWFNRAHDGICLEAVGAVTLTAANPEIANPDVRGYPAW